MFHYLYQFFYIHQILSSSTQQHNTQQIKNMQKLLQFLHSFLTQVLLHIKIHINYIIILIMLIQNIIESSKYTQISTIPVKQLQFNKPLMVKITFCQKIKQDQQFQIIIQNKRYKLILFQVYQEVKLLKLAQIMTNKKNPKNLTIHFIYEQQKQTRKKFLTTIVSQQIYSLISLNSTYYFIYYLHGDYFQFFFSFLDLTIHQYFKLHKYNMIFKNIYINSQMYDQFVEVYDEVEYPIYNAPNNILQDNPITNFPNQHQTNQTQKLAPNYTHKPISYNTQNVNIDDQDDSQIMQDKQYFRTVPQNGLFIMKSRRKIHKIKVQDDIKTQYCKIFKNFDDQKLQLHSNIKFLTKSFLLKKLQNNEFNILEKHISQIYIDRVPCFQSTQRLFGVQKTQSEDKSTRFLTVTKESDNIRKFFQKVYSSSKFVKKALGMKSCEFDKKIGLIRNLRSIRLSCINPQSHDSWRKEQRRI